jgi:hypothetical protein
LFSWSSYHQQKTVPEIRNGFIQRVSK